MTYSLREVGFKNAFGDCLTVGKYNESNDSYNLVQKECADNMSDQIFIVANNNKEYPIVSDILEEDAEFIINGNNKSTISERFKNLSEIK